MQATFKHSRGLVVMSEKVVNQRVDATQVVTITITRNDNQVFRLTNSWVWTARYGKKEEIVNTTKSMAKWMKQHHLPSLSWIEEQWDALQQAYTEEDPMGCLEE